MWLDLVRSRCLRRFLEMRSALMTADQRVALLDAAMKSHDATAYLAGVQSLFESDARMGDALTTASLRALIQAGEIETVMRLRAEWLSLRVSAQPRPGRST